MAVPPGKDSFTALASGGSVTRGSTLVVVNETFHIGAGIAYVLGRTRTAGQLLTMMIFRDTWISKLASNRITDNSHFFYTILIGIL